MLYQMSIMIRAVVRSMFVVCVLAGVGLAGDPAPAAAPAPAGATTAAPAKTAAKGKHHKRHAKKAKARKADHRKHRKTHAAHVDMRLARVSKRAKSLTCANGFSHRAGCLPQHETSSDRAIDRRQDTLRRGHASCSCCAPHARPSR